MIQTKNLKVMETSQSLSIESFSHSWSVNPEGFFRSSDEASFIEMDPTLPPSQRFFSVSLPPDFSNFDFPVTESPLALIHADELISNGFLVPLFAQPIKSDSFDRAFYSPQQPTPQDQVRSSDQIRCAPLKRCRRLSRRIFRKYLEVIRPICVNLRRFGFGYGRRSSRTEERKRYGFSGVVSSTRTTTSGAAYSVDDWRRSCDSESSIHEAVLHCKRTIVGDK